MSSTPLPSSFDGNSDFYEENRWQKFSRRLKEEPLIPLGCALTCWALYNASRSIRAGDSNRTNRMFRARIYAQGFTLLAMIGGSMYWQTDRQKRKEYDVVIAEKKAKEKNEAWIRELEARDEEEKELRAERQRRRERMEKRQAGLGDGKDKALAEAGEKKGVLEKVMEDGKGASSVVEEGEKKTSILESVSTLVWGKK
ncbi:Respiratory supercomplex factor 1, mitochondrial [Cadophora gregata]|uniref:Respiratory supercomplex factor 1, mitochondrial n=1 Tax=Cadophora gregata TaxID=51156 RepID=UPI0026DB65BD|nr:Respiratory supercomplex factor 1, mitochondrial [Cadophora gregata]KAK0101269.1 Respiratory supercomplex factor 1, mitochondrial [Cadophora gregata]KAK0106719.1 Respiratory supercomplex factor 1, mitochondrial [Cadophora gregata f. sp. sojae]